jgi:succinate dehydrogenase subunit D
MKRSNAPIFWSLFGAGGVLSALVGPVLVYITGIAAPTGVGLPPAALAYPRVLTFAQSAGGKVALFAIIAFFLWHAAHRIYHCLHDFGVHPETATKVLLYGFAFIGSVAAAWILLAIGR